MKRFLPLIACIALVGCEQAPPSDNLVVTPKVAPSTNQVENAQRFVVTSQGTFKAGYDDSVREIFILKDNFTGQEYLGITDCTLIRTIKKKNEEAAEAVGEAVDIALDVAFE